MGEQSTNPGDTAGAKMGDAGKGSFQESQDKGEAGEAADRGDPAGARDQDWHDKLKDELSGSGAPKEGRKDAAGPGRGRV
jgi:hypothetical protein